uniref:Uncharacterized protein n=1 Tax=Ditylum brightwellii TaxID=49249 RepID=A0A7S4SJA6_9STRA
MVTDKLFYDRNQRRNLPSQIRYTTLFINISIILNTTTSIRHSFHSLLQLKHYSFYIISCHAHHTISQDVATVKYPTYHTTATNSNSSEKDNTHAFRTTRSGT